VASTPPGPQQLRELWQQIVDLIDKNEKESKKLGQKYEEKVILIDCVCVDYNQP
jgi:hypothetical protein